jgi:TetR/AcrR family transcriptional repressor of nem operon
LTKHSRITILVSMSRHTEFDREEALTGAMRVFWKKGYANTSIADLVEETGVARYGWYTAFGDKDEIFVAALEHYREYLNGAYLNKLRAADADLAAVEAHLRLNLGVAAKGSLKGCFACASALERGAEDKGVAGVVEAVMSDVRAAFRNAIKNALRAGQVRDLPVETLVDFTMNAMRHLSTLVRAGAPRKEVNAYIGSTLALLAP